MIKDVRTLTAMGNYQAFDKDEKEAFDKCKNTVVDSGLSYEQSKRVFRVLDEILRAEMLNRKLKS